ncbi:MAG: LysE family translocator [Chitinophagaceae bacterium]|nr:LysE family translocator [Chitinophagaceae bacterium]
MNTHSFWLFALASLMLNITPGNDMLYVIARSTGQGIKAGIVSSLGVMVGCMVHIMAAVAGLSAIIAQSAPAFNIVKYTGAAYLIYLGVRSLNSKKRLFHINVDIQKLSYKKLFWQGIVTNALNPKVALFFLAFLPQFLDMKSGNTQWQILFLGTWFDVSGTVVNILVAFLFGKIGNWLTHSARFVQWQKRITGAILIGLGIKVALSSSK